MGPAACRAAVLVAACAALFACRDAVAQDVPSCAHVDQGYEDSSLGDANNVESTSSAAECQQSCQNNAQCQLFTWYAQTNACWLYPAGMPLETLPGAVGGPKSCGAQLAATTTATLSASTTSPFAAPTAPPLSAAACLLWYGDGCSKIQSRELCLSSRDGRPFKELDGRLTHGQPCVWCGGGACGVKRKSGLEDTTLCEPYDWVKDAFEAPTDFTVAQCEFGKLLPQQIIDTPEANPRVSFEKIGHACRGATITDAGREDNNYYWTWTANTHRQCMSFCTQKEMCTGIEYHAADSYCEVWWRDIGWTDNSPSYHDYECYRASAPPQWDHPELSCLGMTTQPGGCSSITSQGECLSSRDGRSMLHWNGLRVRGEPCVWCGGEACTDRNGNVCETRDYLLHGQGRVYKSFLAQSHYTVANCTSLADAPETVSPSGRYVTGGQGVFWLSPFGKTRHLVPPTLNCSACGCRNDIETITSSYVEAIPEGEAFSCSLLPGAGAPALAVLGAQAAAYRSSSDSSLTAAARSQPSGSEGRMPWFSWMLMLLVLCCGAGICAVVSLQKTGKKRKRALTALSAPETASDEELRGLMSEGPESPMPQQAFRGTQGFAPHLQQPYSPFHPQPQRLHQPLPPGPPPMPGTHPHAPWPPPHPGGPMLADGYPGAGMPPGACGSMGMYDAHGGFGGPMPPGAHGPPGMFDPHGGVGYPQDFGGGPMPPGGNVRPIQLVGGVDPRRGSMT